MLLSKTTRNIQAAVHFFVTLHMTCQLSLGFSCLWVIQAGTWPVFQDVFTLLSFPPVLGRKCTDSVKSFALGSNAECSCA